MYAAVAPLLHGAVHALNISARSEAWQCTDAAARTCDNPTLLYQHAQSFYLTETSHGNLYEPSAYLHPGQRAARRSPPVSPKAPPRRLPRTPRRPWRRVNGTPISRDFYDFYIKGITGKKAPPTSPRQQRAQALDNLIRAKLVGAAGATRTASTRAPTPPYLLRSARLQRAPAGGARSSYLKDKQAHRAGAARGVRDAGRGDARRPSTTPATSWWRPSRLRSKIIAQLEKGAKFEDARQEGLDGLLQGQGRRPRLVHRRPHGASRSPMRWWH